MKRSQPEASVSPPSKRQHITKTISPVNIGAVCTEDEMNLKVLKFQNKKLAERLEDMKVDEEKMREQLDELKQHRESDLTILSVINRHWIQLDEDMKTLLQRFEGETEDNADLKEASSLSYLDHLASLDSELARAEVAQRATASKQHMEKLLQYVEKSGARVMASGAEVEISATEGTKEGGEQVGPKEGEVSEANAPNLSEVEADNKQLRGLLTSHQQKQQMTSLEFYGLRDKYAVAQKEISQLNNKLQDAEYELQKSTHRVDNLVKRMNEMEEAKKDPEGNTAGVPSTSGSGVKEEIEEEVEKHKELARTRLEELEKLHESYTLSQQEVEKLKLEVSQVPESVIVEAAPYKCLQSQFSVLYNEVTQLRQQLEDTRRVLCNTKTQHVLQLEQFETETLSIQKKYRGEVNELHDALLQVKKDYDLLRMDFEQNLKSNEQTGPMAKEMSLMIRSLQSHNQQLKGEAMRYRQKFNEVQTHLSTVTEDLDSQTKTDERDEQKEKEGKKGLGDWAGDGSSKEGETEERGQEEEGEIKEGETLSSPKPSSKDSEVIKELRGSFKKSQESQKEMKLLLDMYKGASKDLRDKVELLAVEKRLKAEIENLKAKQEQIQQELEKHKGSLADDEAITRLKMADETIDQLQKNLAGTKQAEDALLAEMEFTGQAFEEMQEQNVRIIQQLREKDEANLKLMSERIKANQIQKQLREEKDVLADQVTSLNTLRETQTQVLRKLDERERVLQNAVTSMDKELNLRQQAMELYKRKAIESAQSAQDLKIKFEALQQQMQEVQDSISEKTRGLEEEAYKTRRVQEEFSSLKRKLEKQKKIDLYGAADEVLLEEIKQYKAKLTCPCCNMRKKDAILTKCFHVFCFDCLKTRYDTRQRKCPKCNATFGTNDFHKMYL